MQKPQASQSTGAYPKYVLFILFLTYCLNFVDRNLVSILAQPIKEDLSLTDTQLGWLTGFAFAFFYALVSFPIARLADERNRKSIIAIGVGFWSLMTAVSAAAQSFSHLLLARIGVGIGEAAGVPPAHSLISDYFPPQQRGRAISLYSLGIFAGITLSFVLAGWLAQNYGWRTAFLAIGLPGILLALLVQFTIREPARGAMDPPGSSMQARPPLMETARSLLRLRIFVFLTLGTAFAAFSNYALLAWNAPFLMRVHELSNAQAGAVLGPILGGGGAIGMFLGGFLGDYFGKRGPRAYLWVPAIATFASLPFVAGYLFAESLTFAIASYVPAVILINMHLAPTFAMTQNIVPVRTRATAVAAILFIVNILGVGAGPLVVGVLNDSLSATSGTGMLRVSMASSIVTTVVAAVFFVVATRFVANDND